MYVDSHCHLDFPELAGQIDAVLARMRDNSVDRALCVSVSLPAFPRVLALADAHPNLVASVGVHPDQEDTVEPDIATLVRLAEHPRIVAIGETGLDYYRVEGDPQALCEWQRERFRVHIRAARAADKALIVHTRAAAADTLRIMREEGAEHAGGVMHCFTETWEVARAALDLGSTSRCRDRHVPNAECCATSPAASRGPPADRDRRTLPGPGPVSRQDQRAGLRAPCRRETGRNPGAVAGAAGCDHYTEFL